MFCIIFKVSVLYVFVKFVMLFVVGDFDGDYLLVFNVVFIEFYGFYLMVLVIDWYWVGLYCIKFDE